MRGTMARKLGGLEQQAAAATVQDLPQLLAAVRQQNQLLRQLVELQQRQLQRRA
jgi:hypothetical protein